MPRPYGNPTTRYIDKHVKQLIDVANDDSIDNRLTPGQIHAIVTTILGVEPVAHIASVIKLASMAQSKVTLNAWESIKATEILHYMCYPSLQPTMTVKGKAANSFQLEFAWADPEDATIEGELVK